jgi:hypothetical protein
MNLENMLNIFKKMMSRECKRVRLNLKSDKNLKKLYWIINKIRIKKKVMKEKIKNQKIKKSYNC